jgi:hypothetical protein
MESHGKRCSGRGRHLRDGPLLRRCVVAADRRRRRFTPVVLFDATLVLLRLGERDVEVESSLRRVSSFSASSPSRLRCHLRPTRDRMQLVGRARLELATNGLKVRCSTN